MRTLLALGLAGIVAGAVGACESDSDSNPTTSSSPDTTSQPELDADATDPGDAQADTDEPEVSEPCYIDCFEETAQCVDEGPFITFCRPNTLGCLQEFTVLCQTQECLAGEDGEPDACSCFSDCEEVGTSCIINEYDNPYVKHCLEPGPDGCLQEWQQYCQWGCIEPEGEEPRCQTPFEAGCPMPAPEDELIACGWPTDQPTCFFNQLMECKTPPEKCPYYFTPIEDCEANGQICVATDESASCQDP